MLSYSRLFVEYIEKYCSMAWAMKKQQRSICEAAVCDSHFNILGITFPVNGEAKALNFIDKIEKKIQQFRL